MPYKDRTKHLESVKKWQDEVRRKFYKYKEANPCKDCEKFYPYYVMEFHHVRGKKKYALAQRSASYGSVEFASEMKKCDLLCANCHRIRTNTCGSS